MTLNHNYTFLPLQYCILLLTSIFIGMGHAYLQFEWEPRPMWVLAHACAHLTAAPPCSSDLLLSINFTQNLTFEQHSCCSVTPTSSLSCPLSFTNLNKRSFLPGLIPFPKLRCFQYHWFYVHIRCEVLRVVGSKTPHAPTPFIRVCYSDAIYHSSSIEHGPVSTHFLNWDSQTYHPMVPSLFQPYAPYAPVSHYHYHLPSPHIMPYYQSSARRFTALDHEARMPGLDIVTQLPHQLLIALTTPPLLFKLDLPL